MNIKKTELWTVFTVLFLGLFILFLIYPMLGILQQAVISKDGSFTLKEFVRFFSQTYYSRTIINSFEVSIAITAASLVIGIPFSYFYSFYRLRGSKFLFIASILCAMSAPFIGAYAWILLLGRSGIITKFFRDVFGIKIGNIYEFKSIFMSKEGQDELGKALGTLRMTNSRANFESPYLPKTSEVKWVSRDVNWMIENKAQVLDHWNRIYAEINK